MRSVKKVGILLLVWLCSISGFAAMSTSEVRNNARFITDRMAYELGLSSMQRNDVYEINYDFFEGVRYVMDDLAVGYTYAIDKYYDCLDLRNDDLSYVLTRSQFERFMNKEYFYRPLYVEDHRCQIRIYAVYNNPTHFYFAAPLNFLTYVGIHSRSHFAHGYYCNRYNHPRYIGAWVRPSRHTHYAYYRRHDFGPGIAGRPVHPVKSRPSVRPVAPPARPGINARPNHPAVRPSKDKRPGANVRPNRPDRPAVVHPSKDRHPAQSARPLRDNRPSVRPSERPRRNVDQSKSRPQRKETKENKNRGRLM